MMSRDNRFITISWWELVTYLPLLLKNCGVCLEIDQLVSAFYSDTALGLNEPQTRLASTLNHLNWLHDQQLTVHAPRSAVAGLEGFLAERDVEEIYDIDPFCASDACQIRRHDGRSLEYFLSGLRHVNLIVLGEMSATPSILESAEASLLRDKPVIVLRASSNYNALIPALDFLQNEVGYSFLLSEQVDGSSERFDCERVAIGYLDPYWIGPFFQRMLSSIPLSAPNLMQSNLRPFSGRLGTAWPEKWTIDAFNITGTQNIGSVEQSEGSSWRWSIGSANSKIYVGVPAKSKYEVTLRVRFYASDAVRIREIYVNGDRAEFSSNNDGRSIVFNIFAIRHLLIEVVCPTVTASANDPRSLGYALHSIEIRRVKN